jgi:autophagy-related protein 9
MADIAAGATGSALPFNLRDPHSIGNLYRRRHFGVQPPHQPVPGVFNDHVQFVTSPPPSGAAGLSSSSSVYFPGQGEEVTSGMSLAEKAQEYDRALKQSQSMAAHKRKGSGTSVYLSGSTAGLGPGTGIGAASMYSAARAADLAKTVVLEDSHLESSEKKGKKAEDEFVDAGEEDEMIGGSGLGLGESYVDGARRTRTGYGDGQEGEQEGDEEFLEDGGVLGLLAQIYGRREGPVRAL